MKKLFLSAAALVSLAGVAAAADLPARSAPAPFAAVPAFTWTGFYFGVHAGYLWSDTDVKLTGVGGNVLPFDVELETLPRKLSVEQDGVLGGVQAGYNMQLGMFVAGIEADFSATGANGDRVYSAPDRYILAPPLGNNDITNT